MCKKEKQITKILEQIQEKETKRQAALNIKKKVLYDGFIGDEKMFKGVLFIGLEAHDEKSVGGFFVRDNVAENGWHPKFVKNLNRLYRTMHEKLSAEEAAVIDNNDMSALKECAFINLKKIGGGSKTNATAKTDGIDVAGITKLYKEELIQEIEIIAPNTIVLLGQAKYAFGKELQPALKNIKIMYAYHPSVVMSFENYIKKFFELNNFK